MSLTPLPCPPYASRVVGWGISSVVLSSLKAASQLEGHGLPAEIGFLSWVSFFANAFLVLLQLGKPELDDIESVYVRVLDRGTVVPEGTGWQTFWAGGGFDEFNPSGRVISRMRERERGCCWGFWGCLRSGDEGGGNGVVSGAGVWPVAGVDSRTSGTLNESLLGTVGLESSRGSSVFALEGKRGRGWTASQSSSEAPHSGGCFGRTGRFLCSMLGRTSKAARGDGGGESERDLQRRSHFQTNPSGLSCSMAIGPPRNSVAIAPRPPPQAAAPVYGVFVTRWRLVDADGVPKANGPPFDDVVLDGRASGKGVSSSRTLDGQELSALSTDHTAEVDGIGKGATRLTLQLELAVRSSSRGQMDWGGRGGPVSDGSSSAASHWRVWRSVTDVLALYDALAFRFGAEFCGRVPRPRLRTIAMLTSAPPDASDRTDQEGSRAASFAIGPHRADIRRDARTVGTFLRGLLGLRQFLR